MLEVGHRILFTRYTLTSANISIIPEFTEKIELLGWSEIFQASKQEVVNIENGSEIIFKGIKTSSGNQTANLKSLQGITTWVLDEAEELVDESTFEKIDLSIRAKGFHNRVILILNPTTKEHWIYKRFFEGKWTPGENGAKGDTTYIHTTYMDNIQNLSESFVQQVENLKLTKLDKFKHIVLGGWLDKAEGVIYHNWRQGQFDNTLPVYYGLDFGFSIDPTTLVKIAVSGQKLYCQVLFYKKGLTSNDIVLNLKQHIKANSLIVADSAEPRLIEEIKQSGFNIMPTTKGADSVRAGIKLLESFEIIVVDSPELESELNNYVWSDKKSDTPIDAYNHALDAIRYVVSKYRNLNQESKATSYGKGKRSTLKDFYKDVL